MKVLVVAENRDGRVEQTSMELLTAATKLAESGGEVVVFVAGADISGPQAVLGSAHRMIAAVAPALRDITPEALQNLVLQVVTEENPDLVLTSYSTLGLDLSAWLAGRAGIGLAAYVTGAERDGSTVTVQSQLYGGKLSARTELTLPCVLSVTPGSFAEAPPVAAPVPEMVDPAAALAKSRMRLIKVDAPDTSDLDLTSCERIVCVGRGISDESGVERARNLAHLLSAELAGSRPVVDSGMLEKRRQVGKSGQKVKPKLYIALGVSGAPEHLEGMSGSDMIVAINSDADAPIFNVAHYASTCDLFEFMDELTDLLNEARPS